MEVYPRYMFRIKCIVFLLFAVIAMKSCFGVESCLLKVLNLMEKLHLVMIQYIVV